MTTPIQRLQQLMRGTSFDLFVIIPSPSLRYLTGLDFHLMERPTILFVPASGEPAMVLPELERQRLAEAQPSLRSFSYGETESERRAALSAAAQLFPGSQRVGVEPLRMRFFEQELLQEVAAAWHFDQAEDVIGELRLRKSPEELEHMARAVQIAETALEKTLPAIKPGVTEQSLAAELVVQLLRAGSDPDLPFNPIVASGPNSALPHATPTGRRLEAGDLLIIDWGARSEGYISDLTRTFILGKPTEQQAAIHGLVLAANLAGQAAIKPGIRVEQVDQAARAVIDEGGYGAYFIHRTGHGIGLESHEPPNIRADDSFTLAAGMTFTVEPGIYLPGEGGVRIEDNVAVTETGVRTFSTLPRALIQLS
jgi:Xaa-Pro dipeptidase